jgi:DNA-binding response OmpR family regulator
MKHRLLLVEGAAATLSSMQEYFEALGFEVVRTGAARDARETLLRPGIAALLIELCADPSEVSDRLDVIRGARRPQAGLPIVVLADGAPAAFLEEARRLGADVVLERTSRLAEVAENLERLLNGAGEA